MSLDNKINHKSAPASPESFVPPASPVECQESEGKAPGSPTGNTQKTNEYAVVHMSQKSPPPPKSIQVHDITPGDKSLSFIAKSQSLFRKFSKTQAKIIDSEIKTERENKKSAEVWEKIKHAFHAELNHLNTERQSKKSFERH